MSGLLPSPSMSPGPFPSSAAETSQQPESSLPSEETPSPESSELPSPTSSPETSSDPLPTTSSSPSSSPESPTTSSSPPTTSSTPETSEAPTTSSKSSSSSSSSPTTTEFGATVTRFTTLSPSDSPTASSSSPLDPNATTSGLPPSSSTAEASAGGLSAGGTIAVAVVVPVVSVALIIIALLFWWRKRKANKLAEEERKQEIEEYRFNPNNDPTLPAVGGAGSYDGGGGLRDSCNSGGYRGWGTTSNSRRAGTNPSSGSNGGYPREVSPVDDGFYYPDDNYRQGLGQAEPVGALPTTMPSASAAHSNNRAGDIQRGPSNASSAYSAGNHSDLSDDVMQGGVRGEPYYDESQYYHDGGAQNQYELSQPVIRDVQARRNTRIESPSVIPQQGNAGIAQNF